MNKHLTYILFCLPILIISCSESGKNSHEFYLEESSNSISLSIDTSISHYIKALFVFTDKEGESYLVFQNDKKPEILFYDIKSQKLFHRLGLELYGSNGVGYTLGFYVKDWDEVYITSLHRNEIYIVDRNGRIKRKIDYKKYSEELPMTAFQSMSFGYTPILLIDNRLYITQHPNRAFGDEILEKSPVTIVLDTLERKAISSEFTFPLLTSSENYYKTLSTEFNFSRIFDGERIIYSFGGDEHIYITNKENELKDRKNAKSKYLPLLSVKAYNLSGINSLKKINEIPGYGNLIYDEYRDVYYRVAYPETELANDENFGDVWQYGRKKFSIIILDKDLEVIGETLFPEEIFVSTLLFVLEDGLYICDNYFKNPDYDDNILSFRRFDLKNR